VYPPEALIEFLEVSMTAFRPKNNTLPTLIFSACAKDCFCHIWASTVKNHILALYNLSKNYIKKSNFDSLATLFFFMNGNRYFCIFLGHW
jgi:hypothetical protein